MKLTPAHLKFLLIKALHLLVVVIITLFLVIYCQKNQQRANEKEEILKIEQEKEIIKNDNQINIKNQNVNDDMSQNFADEERVSQIILMDTDEFDAGLKYKTTEIALSGTDTTVKPQDMPGLLEKKIGMQYMEGITDMMMIQ